MAETKPAPAETEAPKTKTCRECGPSETFVSLLTPLSDTVLIEELKKRGYTGTISKTLTVEL